VTGTWKTPKVGQTNFSVELDAGGGHPPYSWEVAIVDQNGKLSWLTYKISEDTKTTLLINKVENDKPVSPQEAAEESEGLKIKVTVRDNTKQGEKDRIDNKGAKWETPVKIEKCPSDVGCVNDDGCCPADCTIGNDNDCSSRCGDGIVTSPPETCDTKITSGIGACPTSCDDSDPCTMDVLENGGTCTATCTHTEITACLSGDGCCPTGANCNNITDNDCSGSCGNGIVEDNETCDGNCPTSCDDGNVDRKSVV
jgi:hypothetical protein